MEVSPSLDLLLQFQRLLVSKIFSKETNGIARVLDDKVEEDLSKPTSEIGMFNWTYNYYFFFSQLHFLPKCTKRWGKLKVKGR